MSMPEYGKTFAYKISCGAQVSDVVAVHTARVQQNELTQDVAISTGGGGCGVTILWGAGYC